MKNNSFAILVNTTDSFEDCWEPFFKLFNKNWPNFRGKIYLNTETKDYQYIGLNIVALKNRLTNNTWSQCLKYALNSIEEEAILYLQEDYFIHSAVNEPLMKVLFDKFIKNKMDCLHLTDQATSGPFNKDTGIENVWEIRKGAKYRLSTQAAFWQKVALLKLIKPWESGWQFEYFGTKRSNYLLNNMMCVSRDLVKKDINEIIPYVFTGIIKGKWKTEVAELFKNNSIKTDLNLRGFYEHKPKAIKDKFRTNLVWSKNKNKLKSIIDLQIIKIKNVMQYG